MKLCSWCETVDIKTCEMEWGNSSKPCCEFTSQLDDLLQQKQMLERRSNGHQMRGNRNE
jgi:hypothetical protein